MEGMKERTGIFLIQLTENENEPRKYPIHNFACIIIYLKRIKRISEGYDVYIIYSQRELLKYIDK